MINVITAVWEFILDHFWSLTALLLIAVYGRTFYRIFIFDPLAGGNGKVQMDELAKGIVIAIIIWAVQRDGYRTHEWAYFSDAFYAALLGALFAIAAIKPAMHILKKKDNGDKDKDTDHPDPHV